MKPETSNPRRLRTALPALILAAVPLVGLAQDPGTATPSAGRYQAVVVPQAGRSAQSAALNAKVLILDSRDGHLWTWSEGEALYGSDGRPQFGTVLIYQGRIRPGSRMGEVIEQFVDK